SIERANAVIDRLPLMPGAKELVESVKGMGLATAMITCGFMISARNIGDLLGIDHVIANDLATNDGVFTGEVIGDLTEADSKAHALEQLSRKCGIKPCECITIGDGANDIHLFRESGYSIAFRAKPILKQYADVAVDTKDLRAIIPIIRDVLQIDTGRTSRQNRRIPSKC
ncbi:MAG: HAD family phosphatase, partial [Methanosarcinales archaeon]|nr:HAD family phosphatase [Methanosarcinales archaeon]